MKTFNTIIGGMAIFGGVYCIFWPEIAFLNAGWIVTLVTFLWGVCAIVNFLITRKLFHKKDGEDVKSAALGLTFGVGACVLSIMATTNIFIEKIFLVLILVLLMAFLTLIGLQNIIEATRIRNSKKPKGWLTLVIFGAIQVLLALTGVLHWLITGGGDDLTNILIGGILIVFGVTLIATIFSPNRVNLWEKL